ncbi:MAG TPA: acVLRF1 family peptidyl-tRNA hydrolase [Nocardioidaceae bacterium]|nr:acVLRF1 family peptidyl-tRNA hydrolase [Nocardioidaceae bacterium]
MEVEPERLGGWVERFRARHGELVTRPAGGDVTIAAPDGATATLMPPWPASLPPGPGQAGPMEQLLAEVQRPRTVGLLLVRRGGYAVGVAGGGSLVASKVGSRYVQGTTKAGGWSQQRYARRREAQARAAFGAAAETAARILLPAAPDLEGLVTGGDRAAVRSVLDDARLQRLAALPQGRFLAVPDPRLRVLEDAVRRSRAVLVDVYDPTFG